VRLFGTNLWLVPYLVPIQFSLPANILAPQTSITSRAMTTEWHWLTLVAFILCFLSVLQLTTSQSPNCSVFSPDSIGQFAYFRPSGGLNYSAALSYCPTLLHPNSTLAINNLMTFYQSSQWANQMWIGLSRTDKSFNDTTQGWTWIDNANRSWTWSSSGKPDNYTECASTAYGGVIASNCTDRWLPLCQINGDFESFLIFL
jgi:hypothetical protein